MCAYRITLLVSLLVCFSFCESLPPISDAQTVTPMLVRTPKGAFVQGLPRKPTTDKILIIEFWATWCPQCLTVMPYVDSLQEALKGRPVLWLSVTQEDTATVNGFNKKRALKGWHAFDRNGALHSLFMVHSLPQAVVLDQQGRLLGIVHPGNLNKSIIDALLTGKSDENIYNPFTPEKSERFRLEPAFKALFARE